MVFLLLRIPTLKIKMASKKEVFEANLRRECDLWHLMVKEMWAGRKLADSHKVWAARPPPPPGPHARDSARPRRQSEPDEALTAGRGGPGRVASSGAGGWCWGRGGGHCAPFTFPTPVTSRSRGAGPGLRQVRVGFLGTPAEGPSSLPPPGLGSRQGLH